MNRLLPLVYGLVFIFANDPLSAADGEWRSLFNGKDLSGWELYLAVPPSTLDVPGAKKDEKGNYTTPLGIDNDPMKIVSVVEADGKPALRLTGEIHGGLTTVEAFDHFHLRLQFRWGKRREGQRADQLPNSGVIYHAFGEQAAFKSRWMQGHQFQLQPGNCGDYVAMGDAVAVLKAVKDGKRVRYSPTGEETIFGNTAPAAPNCAKSGDNLEKSGEEWNVLEIICAGDGCTHMVNGRDVLVLKSQMRSADGSLVPLTKGRIQLQMEGWELLVRDIQIRSLKGAAK